MRPSPVAAAETFYFDDAITAFIVQRMGGPTVWGARDLPGEPACRSEEATTSGKRRLFAFEENNGDLLHCGRAAVLLRWFCDQPNWGAIEIARPPSPVRMQITLPDAATRYPLGGSAAVELAAGRIRLDRSLAPLRPSWM
jgi:hypothetical protein